MVPAIHHMSPSDFIDLLKLPVPSFAADRHFEATIKGCSYESVKTEFFHSAREFNGKLMCSLSTDTLHP